MPLPDERPRQSVANLIGKFEQQTKRQSITSIPPRTLSALSSTSGDAPKVEVKEKREWPPKPKQDKEPESKPAPDVVIHEDVPSKPSLPTPDASPKAEAAPLPREPSPPPVEPPVVEEEPATPVTPELPPTVPEPEPEPEPSRPVPVRQPSAGTAVPPASRTPATPLKVKTPMGRPPIASKPAPARTPAKSPPTSYHVPSTLPASSSAPSGVKPPSTKLVHSQSHPQVRSRPASSASLRPPATPARSRSPAPTRPKTPATAPRPKTPASGLFAPTAASRAKSRNAPDGTFPPVPVKKQTLTPDVAERLSKPTAASLSKARTPTSHVNASPTKATPVKRGVTPARGAAPTRGVAVAKTRGASGAATAKALAGKVMEDGKSAVAETEHHEDAPAVTEAHDTAEGHVVAAEATEVVEEHHEDLVLHDEPAAMEGQHVEEVCIVTSRGEQADGTAVHRAEDVVTDEAILDEQDHEPGLPDSPSPSKFHADDLVDLVSMLEAKKHIREDLIAGEIPDEE